MYIVYVLHNLALYVCAYSVHIYICLMCMSAMCIFSNKEEELYQEAEPVVSTGVSAALQMAMKKGFVDAEKKKKDPSKIVRVYSDEQRDRYVCVKSTEVHAPGVTW